jgi:polyhydroxybutyrate depolymerase
MEISEKRQRTRRIVGIACLVIATLLLISLIIYALRTTSAANQLPGQIKSIISPTSSPVSLCKTPPVSFGDHTETINSTGGKRSLLIHIPSSYGSAPQPLVIFYHGYSRTAQWEADDSKASQEADKSNFIVVYPQGLEDPPSWNAGTTVGNQATGIVDDVQFTRDTLDYMKKNYCVDSQRVYLTGFSLGGGMAFRAACQLADQITALATVAGAYYNLPEGCNPARPLPVLEIHGATDTQAPYNGNSARLMAGVNAYLSGWLKRDGCTQESQVFLQQDNVTGTEWTHCAKSVSVKHYRLAKGGHTWNDTTGSIDVNHVVWEFLNSYKL